VERNNYRIPFTDFSKFTVIVLKNYSLLPETATFTTYLEMLCKSCILLYLRFVAVPVINTGAWRIFRGVTVLQKHVHIPNQ
jgi:hypothetical protein